MPAGMTSWGSTCRNRSNSWGDHMTWKLTCACGWESTGSEDEVVEAAQEHGRNLHNMDVSREQALAMAVALDA